MKEFKGTPAPWSVNTIGQHWNNKSLTHIEVTFGDDGECICDTVYNPSDAQLIAAAPDLLKALCEMLDTSSYSEYGRPSRDSISLGQEAIKKALGEDE